MERTVDITTGESVAFTYELAGLGSRFLAVFLDVAIQLAVAVAGVSLFAWIAGSAPVPRATGVPVSKIGRAVLIGLGSFAAFALFFGYFILFEWRFAGRTPGKRALGIRVVRDGGFPLDFTSAVVRNVVRILEFGAGFYVLSAVATLLSPNNRRFGDMAAGTIVVRDRRYERARTLADVRRVRRADDPIVSELTVDERELIRRYVARRTTLDARARAPIAARIGATIRPRLGATFAHLDDDDLLVHLAATALGGD